MKTNHLLVFLMAFLCYYHRPTDQNALNDINQIVKNETEKWKEELLVSSEVGTPSDLVNQEEWAISSFTRSLWKMRSSSSCSSTWSKTVAIICSS